MKKYLSLIIIVLICFIANSKSQSKSKTLTYKQFIKITEIMNIKNYVEDIFHLVNLYYRENLEYPQTIATLIQVEDNEMPCLFIRELFNLYQNSFSIHSTDTSCIIYCQNKVIYTETNFQNLKCYQCSETVDYKHLVRLYAIDNKLVNDTNLVNTLNNNLKLLYHKISQKNYTICRTNISNTNISIPLYILYQYDTINGLSIHKICSQNYLLSSNYYTQALASLAEEFCKKHNLSKIIFSALLLKENEE